MRLDYHSKQLNQTKHHGIPMLADNNNCQYRSLQYSTSQACTNVWTSLCMQLVQLHSRNDHDYRRKHTNASGESQLRRHSTKP